MAGRAGVLALGIALLLSGLAAAAPDSAAPDFKEVSKVISGDSFELASGAKVGYASVKAPDLVSPSRKIEEMAQASLDFNRNLLEGKKVKLEYGSRLRAPDGRFLAYVYLEDGTFANRAVLDSGFGKVVIDPPNLEHADELRRAASDARREGRGLWKNEADRPTFQFIGDPTRKEFHYPDCPELDTVPAGYRKIFSSSVEAKSADYRFCHRCKNTGSQSTDLF